MTCKINVDMRKRWGLCTSDGVVTVDDELAETDEPFQDSPIVQELLHLRYRTHGKRFCQTTFERVSNWRERERQSLPTTDRIGRRRRPPEG